MKFIIEFAGCMFFYGGLTLIIEHRKELFDLPKIKDVWEAFKNGLRN